MKRYYLHYYPPHGGYIPISVDLPSGLLRVFFVKVGDLQGISTK